MRNFFTLLFTFSMVVSLAAFTNPLDDKTPFDKREEPVEGYIITKDGNRVEGEIIPGSVTDNEVKVTFINVAGKKKTYKPKDLLGYGYESEIEDELGLGETEWIHYETAKADYPPKPFSSTNVFMQRETDGSLSLFTYYVEQRSNPKNPYKYIYYLKDENGKLTKVEKSDFNKVAKKLFKDYTAMYNRIGRKDFAYNNLGRMVRDYNYWQANQHDASEYRVAMKENNSF